MLSIRDPLETQGHIQTESKELEKMYHAKGNHRKMGVAILISDNIKFKIKTGTRDKEEHGVRINPRRRYNNHKYTCTQ